MEVSFHFDHATVSVDFFEGGGGGAGVCSFSFLLLLVIPLFSCVKDMDSINVHFISIIGLILFIAEIPSKKNGEKQKRTRAICHHYH